MKGRQVWLLVSFSNYQQLERLRRFLWDYKFDFECFEVEDVKKTSAKCFEIVVRELF